MDGAIVLDPEAKKISWANVQLMPDPTIHSLRDRDPAPDGRARLEADRCPGDRDLRAARRRLASTSAGSSTSFRTSRPSLSKANQGLATLEKYRLGSTG